MTAQGHSRPRPVGPHVGPFPEDPQNPTQIQRVNLSWPITSPGPCRPGAVRCILQFSCYIDGMKQKETIKAIDAQYVCTFRPEPEGGYTVRCRAFPEIVSY